MCQIVCGFLRRRNATTECDSLHILSTARIKRKGNVCQAVRRSIKCLQRLQLQLQYFHPISAAYVTSLGRKTRSNEWRPLRIWSARHLWRQIAGCRPSVWSGPRGHADSRLRPASFLRAIRRSPIHRQHGSRSVSNGFWAPRSAVWKNAVIGNDPFREFN